MTAGRMAAILLVFAAGAAGAEPLSVEVRAGRTTHVPVRLEGFTGEAVAVSFHDLEPSEALEIALVDAAGQPLDRGRFDRSALFLEVAAGSFCGRRSSHGVLELSATPRGPSQRLPVTITATAPWPTCGLFTALRWLAALGTAVVAGGGVFSLVLFAMMAAQRRFVPLHDLALRLQHRNFDQSTVTRILRARLPSWRRWLQWIRLGIWRPYYEETVELTFEPQLGATLADARQLDPIRGRGRIFAVATRRGLRLQAYPAPDGQLDSGRLTRHGAPVSSALMPAHRYVLHPDHGPGAWTLTA